MTATSPGTPRPASGPERVAEWAERFGPRRHRVHELIGLLTERDWTFAEIVAATGLSRRTVEELLAAAGDDVAQRSGRFRIVPAEEYRTRFARAEVDRGRAPDVLRARIAELVAGAPRPRRALDHVAATPDTVARRADWLAGWFCPDGLRLLCVGDHDLTALAACLRHPGIRAAVVDLDEELLGYVDREARRLRLPIRCYYADLRFGLPPRVAGWADVAFTDPPYTPEGVALFAARGVQGLRDCASGTVAVAYGFGEQAPMLGFKVQRALSDLGLVFTAVLPDFSHYAGAQAIGGRSDLYVCRPTTRTRAVLDRRADRTGRYIYTRGPHATEGRGPALSPAVRAAVVAIATGAGTVPLSAVAGDGWGDGWGEDTGTEPAGAGRLTLARLLADGLPTGLARRNGAVAVNLAGDPGPWLLRALLAVNAARVAVLVGNDHRDIARQDAQQALARLVAPKYRLTFRRSVPAPTLAVLDAERVDAAGLTAPDRLRRHLLDRAGGALLPAWRDGLVAVSRRYTDHPVSRTEARTLADRVAQCHLAPATAGAVGADHSARSERTSAAGDLEWAGQPVRLLDLPRHQIAALLDLAAESLPGHGTDPR